MSASSGNAQGAYFVNPFTTQGMIRDPRLFFGRARELAAIWRHLRKDENVSIVAGRRWGKSSLLWYVKEMAADEMGSEALVHYLDMELVSDAGDFFSRMAELLTAEGETTRDLERALARGRRLVLCLDEFDRTAHNRAFPLDFFAVLRGLSQGPRLTLVVATKTPLIDFSASGGMTSPFYNIFPPAPVALGPLKDDEARALLRQTAARAEITFDDETLDAAIRLAGGHPWHLQLIGSHLVEAGKNLPKARRRFRKSLEENGAAPRPRAGRPLPTGRGALPVVLVGGLGTLAALLGLIGSLTESASALYASIGVMSVTFALAAFIFVRMLLRRGG